MSAAWNAAARAHGAPGAPGAPGWAQVSTAWGQAWEHWARNLAATPFDALRVQYAAGVRAGVLPVSLLEASRFERRVAGLESLLLGPWARAR